MEIIIHIQKKHSTNVQQHNTEIIGNSGKKCESHKANPENILTTN